MGNYSFPFPTIIDTFIKALETALPDARDRRAFRLVFSLRFMCAATAPTAAPFQCYDSGHGGWGACATHDGAGPFRTMAHGDTRIIPVELQESMYPYRLESFSLREDSGGAGKFRGGLGFRKTLPRSSAACTLQTNFERIKCPPWGVQGGGRRSPAASRFCKAAGGSEIISKVRSYALEAGDMVVLETGGGGG